MTRTTFDFEAFRRAVEGQLVDEWLSFYSDDAEWIEYRHNAPPRAPNRMVGKAEIGSFLKRVKQSNVQISMTDQVLGAERAAFCLSVELPGGKQIIENVIVHLKNGRIVREVDVEAWD